MIEFILGNNIEVMAGMPENYFHSIVTDPPYGLGQEPDPVEVMKAWTESGHYDVKNKSGFMGKQWDAFVPQPAMWKQAFRILRPGGHMLVACGTRTVDWMAMSIRFGGFEIRDIITWHYGSGFPKSLNISKEIDKQLGAERKVIGEGKPVKRIIPGADQEKTGSWLKDNGREFVPTLTEAASEEAKQHDGWGTGLKPATEMWILCRKPISEPTITLNVLKWGTGGINIDESRIETLDSTLRENKGVEWGNRKDEYYENNKPKVFGSELGRYPANVILDEFSSEIMDDQAPEAGGCAPVNSGYNGDSRGIFGDFNQKGGGPFYNEDLSGASRFFYCAKPSQSERNKGLEKMGRSKDVLCQTCQMLIIKNFQYKDVPGICYCENPVPMPPTGRNMHPTVKPVKLMRYLVKMITPKGGICLDMHNGSGTTGIACDEEGFDYKGIDNEKEYIEISKLRAAAWQKERDTQLKLL